MLDLVPLTLFIVAAGYPLLFALLARTSPEVWRKYAGTRVTLAAWVVLSAAPYFSLSFLSGDPDVWDFYRSMLVPSAAILGAINLLCLTALAPGKYRACNPS
ncbi:hypothetical protein ACUH97_02340 [Dermabacteraceae bacterium P13088]